MAEIPCVEIPKIEPLKVSLPFGGQLMSLTNIADGPPTDCALAHSLMIQITPMLGSMVCLLNVLKVIDAIKKAATATPPIIGAIDDITSAIDGMADCLGIVLGPIPICTMVKDILLLIISYLNCMIQAVESILDFQIGIDLNAADGNPVLLASLECAQDNAQTSMAGVMDAMQGLGPILELVNTSLSIVGQDPIALPPLSAETPSLADLADGVDPLEPVKTVVETLQTAVSALPC